MSLKISINSLYGALANEYFPLFNRDIAASITGNGRIFIQGVANYVNEKLRSFLKTDHDFLVYGDTDSVYFSLEKIVDKLTVTKTADILDKMVSFDQKFIDGWVQEYIELYSDNFNAFNRSVIGAKLEKIADKGIFVAKKKYALRAVWDEGSYLVENPKMAVTGLEIVRSSTPKFCRVYLKKSLPIIMDQDEKAVADFIKDVKVKFMEAPLDDIARVSGIGTLSYIGDIGSRFIKVKDNGSYDLNKMGKPQTAPINARAALNSNIFAREQGIDSTFPQITAKDKIKYIFLKTPNIVGDDVIAFFDSRFLEKSGVDEMADREHMFETFFMQPLNLMLDAVQYNVKKNFEMDLDAWDF